MSEEEFIKKYKEKELAELKTLKRNGIKGILLLLVFYTLLQLIAGTMQIAFTKGLGTVLYLYAPTGFVIYSFLLIYTERKGGIKSRWEKRLDNKDN